MTSIFCREKITWKMVASYNAVTLWKPLCSTWNFRVRRLYTSMSDAVKTKRNEWSWVEDAPCWPCWCRSRNTGTTIILVHRVLTSVASASVHDFLHEDHTKSTRQKIFWFFCKMFWVKPLRMPNITFYQLRSNNDIRVFATLLAKNDDCWHHLTSFDARY